MYNFNNSNVIYSLCNKKNLFTHGDNAQYIKALDLAGAGAKIHDLATCIWICSSDEFTLEQIEEFIRETGYKEN